MLCVHTSHMLMNNSSVTDNWISANLYSTRPKYQALNMWSWAKTIVFHVWYIYSLLIKKDICENISIKLPYVYVCFLSRDLLNFAVRVSSFYSCFSYVSNFMYMILLVSTGWRGLESLKSSSLLIVVSPDGSPCSMILKRSKCW